LYISQTQANSPINPDSKHFLCPPRCGNQLFPDPFRLGTPDSRTARVISSYSGGDNRVEMNLPRFSFLGSIGLPTLFVSLIWTFWA
jgi:hypothetical protein